MMLAKIGTPNQMFLAQDQVLFLLTICSGNITMDNFAGYFSPMVPMHIRRVATLAVSMAATMASTFQGLPSTASRLFARFLSLFKKKKDPKASGNRLPSLTDGMAT